jgi:hypothetical protein
LRAWAASAVAKKNNPAKRPMRAILVPIKFIL